THPRAAKRAGCIAGQPSWYVERRDFYGIVTESEARGALSAARRRRTGRCMESVEHIVVGAGPAGLRAAQVLAEAGRDVVVLEKNARVGPKTCGGGLSSKAVRELERLGLPPEAGLTSVARVSFRGDASIELDPQHARIKTLSRERL